MSQRVKNSKDYFLVCPYSGCTEKLNNKDDVAKRLGVKASTIPNLLNKVEDIKSGTKTLKKPKSGYCIFDKKPGATIARKVMSEFTPDNEQFAEFGGKFYVSQYGRVKTLSRSGNEIFVVQKEKKNKLYVRAYLEDNKTRWFTVARVVAEKFVVNDDPAKNTFVVHIDSNSRNNKSINLKWVKEGDIQKYRGVLKNAKPILKICPETLEEVDRYISCAEAARDNFMNRGTICDCIREKGFGMACGWIWKIDEDFYKGVG